MSNYQLSDNQAAAIAKAIYADIQAFCDAKVVTKDEATKE